jgi:class 3 adenylate cyclase/tetratricopeptide (TPR) repeat protein
VFFSDLVNSTAIAAQFDPEEWRDIVASYHRAATQAITQFGGYVAHYLGDGVMAYFGWPEAHDNDAERATRAGLAILDAIGELNSQSAGAKLAARVGINSGAVVVGASAGKDADVFGDVPNIAARVQGVGEPDTVVITAETQKLISGLFVVEDLGARQVKGVEHALQIYRVIRPSGVRGRLEAGAAVHGLTPFVGREEELRLLMNRWELARDGEGQVVTIVGEAGIGKSRLVHRFHEKIADASHTWLEFAAAPYFQNTPFYVVAKMLEQGFYRGHLLAALEASLEQAETNGEVVPKMVALPGLPTGETEPPSALTPEQQRKRLLATLVARTVSAAKDQPLVIATEDLHWADPSTLELIQLLVEQGATVKLLLLYTARPEFRLPWPLRAHHTQINLNRLSARNVRTMVAEVAARKALTDETVATVVERTSGVPLFVEELTRVLLESGDAKPTARAIPVTLHDSLMARLDRLGPAKEIAQVAAVIGSEFSYDLLHAVHPFADDVLQGALQRLTDAELVYVRGLPPSATYQFKHALIRDAAYEALLKTRRKELHGRVAHTIGERFPDFKKAHPEVLARHFTEAGEVEAAIAEWSRAGKAAQDRNAFAEARDSYQQALASLNLLPESPERDLRELELRQAAHVMVTMTKGWAATETVSAAEHLTALAEKSGRLASLGYSLMVRGLGAWFAGDYLTAGALANEALKVLQREGNPTYLAGSYWFQLAVRYWRGDLAGSEQHFLAGLAFFEDPLYRQAPIGSPVDALGYGALNAWTLGRPDVARERLARMMAAVDHNNPSQLTTSAFLSAWLHLSMREFKKAETLAVRAIELSEQHQFPNYAVGSRCLLGAARGQLGRATEAIALLREGMTGTLRLGTRLASSVYPLWLSETQDREGDTLTAMDTIGQALEANPDELIYRPEALRVRGELRLKQTQEGTAEIDFRESIALAQEMGAKAWELRATTSLARLLSGTDRREEARAMLAEIYNWFTEGFDTADLKEAKALLDELTALNT